MKTFNANLLTVAPVVSAFPEPGLSEIAVVGRSNAGKSTLVNTLVGKKKLARVSRTPGRTRAIIFFNVEEKFLLVDLPGYGFAAGPREDQASWQKLVGAYLGKKRPIKGVIALFDIRRKPDRLDHSLLAMFNKNQLAWQAVWTKADKLSKRQVASRRKELDQALAVPSPGIPFSSKTRQGRDLLLEWIDQQVVL
jgi:GTP-binding protein